MSLIDDSDKLRKSIIDGLLDPTPEVEKLIFDAVQKYMDKLDHTGGMFDPTNTSRAKVIELQDELYRIIKRAGYFKNVNTFIADLGKITQNTIDLMAGVSKVDVVTKGLSGIERATAQGVVELLNEGGLNTNFIQPVASVLNDAITLGYSISETRTSLQEMIIGNEDKLGKLNRYLTVTARDTVSQLQGKQFQSIANEAQLPFLRYIGNIQGDSRGQCVRWKRMGYLAVADLKEEIALAYRNQKKKAKEDGHLYSGMIENTRPDNFIQFRGGWGCLHQAIPVRRKG